METRLDASRLGSLLESAQMLGGSLRQEDQLQHLLRTIMGRLLITRALVALRDGPAWRVAISRGVSTLKPGMQFDPASSEELKLVTTLPIGDPNEPLGLLCLGRAAAGNLDASEFEFLSALLNIAATSLANARSHQQTLEANRALDQKIQEQRALLDLVRALTATVEPEEVAQLLMLTLSGRYAVRRHAILTWKPGQPEIVRARGLDPEPDAWRAALGESNQSVCYEELLLFPLRSADSTVGLIALGPRSMKLHYSDNDLDFITGLIAQASVALDNAWHFRDTLYRQRLEKELAVAASIQVDLFPKNIPFLPGTDLAARNRQARQVGGDYYDVLPAPAPGAELTHLLCVADISGKGLSAALLMANIQATLRALLASAPPLTALAAQINELLWASTPSNKYATAIFILYDPVSGRCQYVNAGHSEGIVLRATGHVDLLESTGTPIGLLPRRTFESDTFELHPGDTLLLYSDGVTDACTVDNVEFGLDKTVSTLKTASHLAAPAILDALIEAIDAHAAGAPQFDDITAMVVKRSA
jgi:sigma-B regulation protein RsbU (phosphoserine phosphatase)